MTDEERFRKWLKGGFTEAFQWKERSECRALIRVPKQDGIEYLYLQSGFQDNLPNDKEPFVYAGIFYQRQGLIYDAHRELRVFGPDTVYPYSRGEMCIMVTDAVQDLILARLGKGGEGLRGQKIQSPRAKQELEDYRKYYAEPEARRRFLFDQTEVEDPILSYEFVGWDDGDLPRYIVDPESFEEEQASMFWRDQRETLLLEFLKADALRAELKRIVNQVDSSLYGLRSIIRAANDVPAKTVRVTVHKDEKNLAFPMSADDLRQDPGDSGYSIWSIPAQERQEYERIFGSSDAFLPEEITRITYNGRTLYEAEPLGMKESKDQGQTLSM